MHKTELYGRTASAVAAVDDSGCNGRRTCNVVSQHISASGHVLDARHFQDDDHTAVHRCSNVARRDYVLDRTELRDVFVLVCACQQSASAQVCHRVLRQRSGQLDVERLQDEVEQHVCKSLQRRADRTDGRNCPHAMTADLHFYQEVSQSRPLKHICIGVRSCMYRTIDFGVPERLHRTLSNESVKYEQNCVVLHHSDGRMSVDCAQHCRPVQVDQSCAEPENWDAVRRVLQRLQTHQRFVPVHCVYNGAPHAIDHDCNYLNISADEREDFNVRYCTACYLDIHCDCATVS